jgi:hypothetical protein
MTLTAWPTCLPLKPSLKAMRARLVRLEAERRVERAR